MEVEVTRESIRGVGGGLLQEFVPPVPHAGVVGGLELRPSGGAAGNGPPGSADSRSGPRTDGGSPSRAPTDGAADRPNGCSPCSPAHGPDGSRLYCL